MRVALTGASGFIGSFICRELRERGHGVVALVRETSRRDHIEDAVERFVVGDQADDGVWPELVDGCEGVIHNSVDWAPLRDPVDLRDHLERNLSASVRFLHASAPRRFVFMSSIAVHHDMLPRWNGVIDEDHPMRPSMLYGAYKAAVEPHLWHAHFADGRHTAAVRPCGVYGIDPDLERSHGFRLIEKIREGEAVDRAGGGKFVHVEDVARLTVAALEQDGAAGRPFNAVDCYARWADWGLMAREVVGADVEVDTSSPAEPKNVFTKDACRELGVGLDRGHAGIRAHLSELAKRMGA